MLDIFLTIRNFTSIVVLPIKNKLLLTIPGFIVLWIVRDTWLEVANFTIAVVLVLICVSSVNIFLIIIISRFSSTKHKRYETKSTMSIICLLIKFLMIVWTNANYCYCFSFLFSCFVTVCIFCQMGDTI